MGKSKEFNTILNECLERLLAEGETIEQCLERFPQHREELKSLLETAWAAKKASVILPRSEFRDKARYQFHLALQGMERKRTRFFFGWQPRWAAAIAIVLALLLAGSSTFAAAGNSMPGEPLYPVKLAAEQARLILTPSALGKAEFYARLADKRVLEIVHMAGQSKPEQVERMTGYLDIYLTRIADLTSTERVVSGIPIAPDMQKAPPLREGGKEGWEAYPGADRRSRLRSTMMRHAAYQPARLRALLKTVPESARPALLRAIAISERGYDKALQSLDEQGQLTE